MRVEIDYDELDSNEIDVYVNNFLPTYLKGNIGQRKDGKHSYHNEYDKQVINPSKKLLEDITNILNKYVPNHSFIHVMSRINRVGENTNPSDDFHNDLGGGDIIFLHYPNSNPYFEGGELEWYTNDISEINKIDIKNGMNVIMFDNPHHRVKNVTKGIRYSLAFFFYTKSKKEIL